VFLIRTESFPLMIVVLRWFIPILVVSASTSSNSRYREFSRPAKNAYQILQIDNRFPATQEDIKSQYRKLCLKYHPDKNTQKSDSERKVREQRFKEIQLAYENLKDPIHRREYDVLDEFVNCHEHEWHNLPNPFHYDLSVIDNATNMTKRRNFCKKKIQYFLKDPHSKLLQ